MAGCATNRPAGFVIEPLENRSLLSAVGYSPANIVAYFPDYRFSSWGNISLSGLSEINYFSITANNDGSLPNMSTSGDSFSQLQTIVTACHAASPRVAVSIVVDWHTSFLTIAQSPTASTAFVSNLIAFCSTYKLDGLDLDYEPGTLTAAQENTYGGLLASLHAQTSAHDLILSEAVQASQMIIPQAYLADIDRYNLMDYELEYNSSAPYSDSITYLTDWANYGVPKSKLLMGVPFYGSSGTSWSNHITETYAQIATAYAAANNGAYPATNLDSVTIDGTTWGYNGIATLQEKAQYVLQNGYGGMMIWELGQDLFVNNQYTSNSLLPAVKVSFAGAPSTALNAGTLLINGAVGGGATTLSESGGSFTISSPASTYSVSSSTVNSIFITGSGGSDTINVTSTLDKPVTFIGGGAGGDTLNVSAGTVDLQSPITGAGITAETLGTLSIASGASVVLLDSTSHSDRTLLMLNALTIAGSVNAWTGKLDLGWNDLLVHGGNIPNVTNQLLNGKGLISSNVSSDTTHRTAIGIANGLASFDGYAVATTDLLVKYTYYGDANLDGKVDGSDYTLIDNGYLHHLTGWFDGDFNYDGVVNGSDYTLIDNAFNSQAASMAAIIAPANHQAAASVFVASSDSSASSKRSAFVSQLPLTQILAWQDSWAVGQTSVSAAIFNSETQIALPQQSIFPTDKSLDNQSIKMIFCY